MSYLGTKPQTATEVADGVVTPSDLSTGHPTWDTSGNLTLDNGAADGAQLVLKSAGYSSWNIDNYSGSLRAYYNATEYMRMDSSGNLGIGTSSPALKLHVAGDTGGYTFKLLSNTTVSGSDATIFRPADNTMAFSTAAAERMRILSNGVVVMGTSTENGTNGVTFGSLGASTPYGLINQTATGTVMFFRYNSSTVGYISQNGSSTAYNTSSDYRLKENIAPMTGALAKVAQLKPCTYTWKATGQTSQGFIAHELQEVVPDAVSGEKDAVNEDGSIKAQGIDTSFLVATLTAAIQEQQAIITSLEARLTALESK